MKLTVLGGCADMARPLFPLLQQSDVFHEVVIADINSDAATALADAYGDKFSARRCDATNADAVTALLRDCDVVACFVGPFYRFEKPLAQCAISAGAHYVSIADDYDAYLDVITLDESARMAGVKVLTGFGNSPGITQLLARMGYNALETVRRIHVHWCAGAGETVGVSNLTHLFHIFNGATLQWQDGREVRVNTGNGKKRVSFPEPIGDAHVYYTGHAESVSLPRNLPGLQEVTLHGGVKPHYIVTLLKVMQRLGVLNSHKRRAALARFFHGLAHWFPAGGYDKSVGRVDVVGEEDGKSVTLSYTYVGPIAAITALPTFLAATWLASGRFDHKPGGVYAPEALLDAPDTFIDELRTLGVDIRC